MKQKAITSERAEPPVWGIEGLFTAESELVKKVWGVCVVSLNPL